ncbi:hypothetical protein [Neorhizobium alkalisoli]|uniref:hypothetical protein n=1 Tax=Neorhizobium alkalisoli TaxID=528178 RepID=UPI00119E1E3E|nr:hypothetical protein [Neorhizobium alkalisoli]
MAIDINTISDAELKTFSHLDNPERRSLYIAYHNMRQRCRNPNHPAFHHYGGRRNRMQVQDATRVLDRGWSEAFAGTDARPN